MPPFVHVDADVTEAHAYELSNSQYHSTCWVLVFILLCTHLIMVCVYVVICFCYVVHTFCLPVVTAM